MIVARALTDSTVDDATTGTALIGAVEQDIARVTGDAAYDTVAFYAAARGRRASIVVPPHRTARVSRRRPRSSARDRTIRRVQAFGRRRWKKASGYHRQARVENVFFRYKRIVGDGLRARSDSGRRVETCLVCNVLKRGLITGNEDGAKHCSMNILYSLSHLGYVIPPQADSGWLGPVGPGPSYLDPGSGGPESDFTNCNTTFMTWNLMHLARLIKDAGGIPPHSNQRSKWGRFDYPNPEHR